MGNKSSLSSADGAGGSGDKKRIPSLLDLRSNSGDGDRLASAARRSVQHSTRPRFGQSRGSVPQVPLLGSVPQVPLLPGPLPPSGLPQMMRMGARPRLMMMPPPQRMVGAPPGFFPAPPPGYVPGFFPPMGMPYAVEQCFGSGNLPMGEQG